MIDLLIYETIDRMPVMRRNSLLRWGLMILLSLGHGTALAASDLSLTDYESRAEKILSSAKPRPIHTHEFEGFWRKILAEATDDETRYLATQYLNRYLDNMELAPEAWKNCQSLPPRADDFMAQAICVGVTPDLDNVERADAYEKIFHEARLKSKGSMEAANIIYRATNHMAFIDDIPRAVSLLRQALETVPLEARAMQANLKRNMAMLSITPSNSLEIIRQGIALFEETEQFYRNIGDWISAENSAYNKAIAHILSTKDYAAALTELDRVQKDATLVPDAMVFRAFTLAKLGRFREAERTLSQVDLKEYRDEERIPFMQCYMQLTRAIIDPEAGLGNCTDLPKFTQTDVILHLTEEISQRSLLPQEERLLYRQFYWFYQNKIAPSIRTTLTKSIDSMELQRTRYESRLKDAQLDTQKRYSLVKTYALIGSILLLLGLSASWFRILKQHRKIQRLNLYIQKQVLQRFLPPEIINEILAGRNRLDESARTMSVTVLFADLCEFTRQSESLGPERTAIILNDFLVRMTEVIFSHGGTIDKFMGDGIMVIFGAPTELPEAQQASKAVSCAIAMQKALEGLNEKWQRAAYPAFKMRVGIHQGHAVVGSFGGPQRSDFTVIGSTVNISSRIERMANPGDILISRELARHLPRGQVISIGLHELRGVEQQQELFVLKEMRWHSVSA
jgi:class 3 adenylate cyclase